MLYDIEQAVKLKLPGANVVASTSDNVHYSLKVSSKIISDLPRIKQHQLIYSALTEHIGANWSELIHALEIKIIQED